MAIRLTGLTSGLDTDSIVQELVSAYSTKTQKYEKAATKLTWKQDIWKGLNTKVYNLYTSVSNLRFSSAYSLKKVTVSDNTKASVTASASAVTGTQTLKVKQTAQTCYMTGGYLGDEVTSDTTLEELGFTEQKDEESSKGASTQADDTSSKQYSFKVKFTDGTTKEITFTKDTTVSQMVTKLKETGLNASFDENNGRIFVSSKKSGSENDFTFFASTTDGLNALSALKLNVALVDEKGNFTSPAGDEYKRVYENYYQEWEKHKDDLTLPATARNSVYGYVDYLYENVYKQKYKEYTEAEEGITKYQSWINMSNREIEIWESKINAIDGFLAARNEILGKSELSDITDKLTRKVVDKMLTATSIDEIKAVYADSYGTEAGYKELSSNQANAILNAINSKADEISVYTQYVSKYPYTSEDTSGFPINITEGLKKQKDAAQTRINQIKNGYKTTDENGNEKFVDGIEQYDDKIDEYRQTISKLKSYMEEHTDLEEIKKIEDEIDKEIAEIKADTDKTQEEKDAEIEGLEAQKKAQVEDALIQLGSLAKKSAEIKVNDGGQYSKADAVQTAGSDAVIVLNGVEYTSSDNNFSINGLSITALSKTTEDITINTSVDTQGIYDTIKDFLTEYNNIINEMTKLYNADSAGDYEPLTDDEKEAMSDEQIEKWETKIKDSLLRRDTSLNSIMSAMINSMAQTFEINGKTYSLSTFGIHTLGYLNAAENENYAYHIDGDEDDENTSGNEEKLMAAIMENPEDVEEFMKKLCSSLYTAIDDKMKSTELSSIYKVYNDKEMDSEMEKYEEAISKWEQKVKDKEDYYYKKFSSMETALSKLESQSSSLSNLFSS